MVMNYADKFGKQLDPDEVARNIKQIQAEKQPDPELALALVTRQAEAGRLLLRADLSGADPDYEPRLTALARDLASLVSRHAPQLRSALDSLELTLHQSLTDKLHSFLQLSQTDHQADPRRAAELASDYLLLRDELELIREGLGQLEIYRDDLQTALALADEQFFENLDRFACVAAQADRFMALRGVDPDEEGPYGFWAAVAELPGDGATRGAGSLLAAAGPESEQITRRLVQAARSRGAPPQYLQRKLAGDAELATRVVATLALVAALQRSRGRISAVAAGPGELESLPDPAEALLLGQVKGLGLELRAQQQPGEVRLILYYPDEERLTQIHSPRVPIWQQFPTGAVGRVAISALCSPAPTDHTTDAPPAPDQICIHAVYDAEPVEFLISLDTP